LNKSGEETVWVDHFDAAGEGVSEDGPEAAEGVNLWEREEWVGKRMREWDKERTGRGGEGRTDEPSFRQECQPVDVRESERWSVSDLLLLQREERGAEGKREARTNRVPVENPPVRGETPVQVESVAAVPSRQLPPGRKSSRREQKTHITLGPANDGTPLLVEAPVSET
jgi:hypothetical protein